MDLKFIPNNFSGMIILEKSLLDKLLSPIILNVVSDLDTNPQNNLAKVPELPAYII